VALLPVELLINIGSTAGFAMVFALLLPAIIWSLGTCTLACLPLVPTLIGSIMGVGLANSIMQGGVYAFGSGVNWTKAKEVEPGASSLACSRFHLRGDALAAGQGVDQKARPLRGP
jgi:phosphate/sulfate permease